MIIAVINRTWFGDMFVWQNRAALKFLELRSFGLCLSIRSSSDCSPGMHCQVLWFGVLRVVVGCDS